jgi:hypothetical protein
MPKPISISQLFDMLAFRSSETPTTGVTARWLARVCERHVSSKTMGPHVRWREHKRVGEVECGSLVRLDESPDRTLSSVTTSNASNMYCVRLHKAESPSDSHLALRATS